MNVFTNQQLIQQDTEHLIHPLHHQGMHSNGIEKEDFPTQGRAKGARLLKNLKEALEDHPNVGDVRGLGMMCGIEIVKDKATGEEFDASEKIGPKVHQAGVERGLFSRVRGDVYCLAPPIITTESQLDQIVEILKDSITEVLG